MLPTEVQTIMAKVLFLIFAVTMLCVSKARGEYLGPIFGAPAIEINVLIH